MQMAHCIDSVTASAPFAASCATANGCFIFGVATMPAAESSASSRAMAGIAAAAVRELEEPAADVADVEEPTDEEATAEEEAAAEEEEEATAEDEEEAAAEDGEAAVPMKLLCAPCSGGAPKCASCLEANWAREYCSSRHTEWWASK